MKKINQPLIHPLVSESYKACFDDPELRRQFAQGLAVYFNASTVSGKIEIINMMREELPEKLKEGIRHGDICTCGKHGRV